MRIKNDKVKTVQLLNLRCKNNKEKNSYFKQQILTSFTTPSKAEKKYNTKDYNKVFFSFWLLHVACGVLVP